MQCAFVGTWRLPKYEELYEEEYQEGNGELTEQKALGEGQTVEFVSYISDGGVGAFPTKTPE